MRNQDTWNLQVLLTREFMKSKLNPVEFLNKLAKVDGFDLIGTVEEKDSSTYDWSSSEKYVSAHFVYEEHILNVYWWESRPTEIFTKF
jgi:hypothetical protein